MPLVRDARPDDALAVATAHVASWRAAYRGILPDDYLDRLAVEDRLGWWVERLGAGRDSRHHIVVVEDGAGRIVGFGSAGPEASGEPEVWQVYLEPDAWGRGHGRTVLDELVRRLGADGHTDAVLWVAPGNDRARRMYERAGWVADGAEQTEELWGVEVTSVRYRRSLTGSGPA